MKISVLIGSRNRPRLVERCVRSVLRQDYDDFEVWVLDDASAQPLLCERLRRAFDGEAPLHCHRSEAVLGVPGGRNVLARHAQGDVLCFLDDDACFSSRHTLSKVAAAFRRHPRAGVLAFKIIDYRPEGTRLRTPFHKETTLRCQPALADCPNTVSHFLGGGHAIRQEAFWTCGAFDETLHFGGEERDLAYRLIEADFTIRYVPGVHVLHRPAASPTEDGMSSKIYYLVRNRLRLSYRYLPWKHLLVHVLAWTVRYGLIACRRKEMKSFWQGVVDGARAFRGTRRTPLSASSIRYLRENYGQLWY